MGVTDIYSDVASQLYGNHTANNFAAFAQTDIKYHKFSFSLGGRFEKNRIDTAEDNLNPVIRTGINYRLAKETFARASRMAALARRMSVDRMVREVPARRADHA